MLALSIQKRTTELFSYWTWAIREDEESVPLGGGDP